MSFVGSKTFFSGDISEEICETSGCHDEKPNRQAGDI